MSLPEQLLELIDELGKNLNTDQFVRLNRLALNMHRQNEQHSRALDQIVANVNRLDQIIELYRIKINLDTNAFGAQSTQLGLTYNNFGLKLYDHDLFDQALEQFRAAQEIFLRRPDSLELAMIYNNIGNVFCVRGAFTVAKEYYQKCIDIRTELTGQSIELASVYNNMGTLLSRSGNFASGLEYLDKALQLRRQLLPSTDLRLAESEEHIGIVYVSLQRFTDAVRHYNIANRIYSHHNMMEKAQLMKEQILLCGREMDRLEKKRAK